MSVITLTTDWRFTDFYVGAVKGAIVSLFPEARIIDVNHQIPSFNTSQAAFTVRHSFMYFPKGTVHLIDVNSESDKKSPHLAIRYRDHYFIGTDNGMFSLMFKEAPEVIVRIENHDSDGCFSFPALHVFAPAAAYLAMGHPIEELGALQPEVKSQTLIRAAYDEASIEGNVIHIDSFQNAITNISKELFERVANGRRFDVLVQSNHYRINRINKTYNETSEGELLALFNSAGLLEIAINKGFVAELLNLGINSKIRIKFYQEIFRRL